MSGVNTTQWRGSIGRFNVLNSQCPSIKDKPFPIFTELLKYLRFFRGHILFVLSLVHSFLVIFGLSCMACFLFPLILLNLMVLGNLLCPGSISLCKNISNTFYIVFSLPKHIFLLFKTFISCVKPFQLKLPMAGSLSEVGSKFRALVID